MILTLSFNIFERPVSKEIVKVTVKEGDTLWEICERHYSQKEDRSFEEFLYDTTERNNARGRYLIVDEVINLELHKVH